MLENLAATTVGKMTRTFLLSMVPVIELRGGLPYGIALGLDYPLALAAAVLGNMVPVPLLSCISGIYSIGSKSEVHGGMKEQKRLKEKRTSRGGWFASTELLACAFW